MKTLRPLWGRGQMISPQHFQQQVNQAAWQSECIARLGVMNPWGIIRVEFDAALLKQGKLKASHLYIRFPDGTLIDSDNADALPEVMVLPQAESRELTVVLALPHEHENGGNCLQMEQRAERPVRWRLAWREVRNRYGEDSRQIAVMLAQLTLRTADDNNGDYQTVAVARLRRDSQDCWSLDEDFIPPLLKVLASRWLHEQTEQLTNQLGTRLQRLMAMRRESNARMADFAVADVSLFWLLNALNSAEPVLNHFLRHPQVHPERLYEALASLAGSLLTFSLDHTTADIPPYRHQALTEVFPPLFKLLGVLLEASLPSRVVAIEMTHDDRRKRWHARLHDPRLREEADFYLSVRSALPAAQLLEQFPQQCKAGNGYGGPRANSYGGGGGFCCVMVPDVWRPGLTAKITWTSDPNSWMKSSEMPDDYETHYQRHGPITVPIERWEEDQACGFDIHIFPCDKVRIVRSCYGRAAPEYPIQPDPDGNKKAQNILYNHVKENIVCPTPQTPR